MTVRQQWGVVLAVTLALAGGGFVVTRRLGDELFPISVGSVAPDFRARVIDTNPTTAPASSHEVPQRMRALSDYRGEVILLNLWATWCEPCRWEMPAIQRLHAAFADKGLKVVAVSIDEPGSVEAIREFVREHALTFEILHDPTGAVVRAYQTTGIPETFVIDRRGMIRKKDIGPRHWDSAPNRALVAQLLAEPAS